MSDYIYSPERLAALEQKYKVQASNLDGDHMTVTELDELQWQQDAKARAIAAYHERQAEQHPAQAGSADAAVASLGEQLAALRLRHAQRGKLSDPNVTSRRSPDGTRGWTASNGL